MARKSRKNIPEVVSSATVQIEASRPFRAGLYARISMETEETLERGPVETQVELSRQKRDFMWNQLTTFSISYDSRNRNRGLSGNSVFGVCQVFCVSFEKIFWGGEPPHFYT